MAGGLASAGNVPDMATLRDTGWALFDRIVATAPLREANPWHSAAGPSGEQRRFEPDYDTLELLLGVPVLLDATSQSGVPALALDVWVAHEFRRAGFDPDRVWPRAREPRVIPPEVMEFVSGLPRREQAFLLARIAAGQGGAKSANLLGKNYVKQVDVVMSSWATGPELMVSTKRMDSSFAKNAANRVEESYGDAKNLRLRHPQAALGFVYGLSAVALSSEPDTAAWLIDLLGKLGREGDAYDAVALVLPDLRRDQEVPGSDDPVPAGPLEPGIPTGESHAGRDVHRQDVTGQDAAADAAAAESGQMALMDGFDGGDPVEGAQPGSNAPAHPAVAELWVRLQPVPLRRDAVPPDLDPGRFFEIMSRRILDGSPVNFHREARRRRAAPLS